LRAYAEPLLRNKLGDKELSRQLNSGGQMGFISPKETGKSVYKRSKKVIQRFY